MSSVLNGAFEADSMQKAACGKQSAAGSCLLVLRCLLLSACGLLLNGVSDAQSVLGRWVTIDDNTGERKAIVEITERGGKVYGHLIHLFDAARRDKTCTLCEDDRKNKPIVGLEIMRGLMRDGDEWEDGTIIDPENGKEYDCRIWVENGTLKLRAYLAFLYRTQTWVRE